MSEFYANETTYIDDIELSIDDKADEDERVYATLHFYHDDPDSKRRFKECNQAADVLCALMEFDEDLRRRWKYGDDGVQMMTVEQVRGLLFATLNRYDIPLGD